MGLPSRNPYGRYQQSQAETASGGQLVVMLYQGAIRFLGRAADATERREIEESHRLNLKVQDIITELMGTLNADAGPVAQNLFRVYEYMLHRLVMANARKDAGMLREVEGLLRELLLAWEVVMSSTPQGTKATAGAGRAAGLAFAL